MADTQTISDAKRLWESLEQLPEAVVKPALIVVSGLPGTGKSYFCRKLAERLPVITLESDALRKTLFTSPTYSLLESSRLFQAIHFRNHTNRNKIVEIFDTHSVGLKEEKWKK